MKYVAVVTPDNDAIIHGELCCTSLTDLYTVLVDRDTTEIEIRKEFADAFFTYSALVSFVENAAAIAPNVRVWVQDTVADNFTDTVKMLRHLQDTDEFSYVMHKQRTKFLSTIRMLCDSYLQSNDDMTLVNNKLATMYLQIDDLQKQLAAREKELKKSQVLSNELYAKLHTLVSRVNYKYEKTLNPDKSFVVSENCYSHILYIKEITRVHYTDTLIHYIQEILKTMYGMPTRTVVIEPYYSYGRESLYEGFVPHWSLKYSDVYAGDIYMAGFQPKLMSDILQNSSHVNYLIILDRGQYMTEHVTGNNVSVVYTCSSPEDYPADIDSKSIISYSEDTLNIPYIEDFNDLSSEVKVMKYSSMPVTKKLINLLEEVS